MAHLEQAGCMYDHAPWPIWSHSWPPLRPATLLLFSCPLLLLPGRDFVELYQPQEANADSDGDLVPCDLAVPQSLAQTLRELGSFTAAAAARTGRERPVHTPAGRTPMGLARGMKQEARSWECRRGGSMAGSSLVSSRNAAKASAESCHDVAIRETNSRWDCVKEHGEGVLFVGLSSLGPLSVEELSYR